MKFVVGGERNSGTNYLEQLIEMNFPSFYQPPNVCYWKHDTPGTKYDDQVELYVIRDLNSWLVSMYHTPYELKKSNSFKEFLVDPQQSFENITQCIGGQNIYSSHYDDGHTIFQIRYHKYANILKRLKKKNVILVHLRYLQSNTELFLETINTKYNLGRTLPYVTNLAHTKDGSARLNRTYDLDLNEYVDLIDLYKDHAVEKTIEELTIKFSRPH